VLRSAADGGSGDTAEQGAQESQARIWTRKIRRGIRPLHKNLHNLQPLGYLRENVTATPAWPCDLTLKNRNKRGSHSG